MYQLIQNGYASMLELKEYYTLSEALKLYALMTMRQDIEAIDATKFRERSERH